MHNTSAIAFRIIWNTSDIYASAIAGFVRNEGIEPSTNCV